MRRCTAWNYRDNLSSSSWVHKRELSVCNSASSYLRLQVHRIPRPHFPPLPRTTLAPFHIISTLSRRRLLIYSLGLYLVPTFQNGYSYGHQFHQLQWQLDYGAFHIVSLDELFAAITPFKYISTRMRLTWRITGPEHLRPNGPRARHGTAPSLPFPSSPQQLS